jgi:thymidylate synthase (FAD)
MKVLLLHDSIPLINSIAAFERTFRQRSIRDVLEIEEDAPDDLDALKSTLGGVSMESVVWTFTVSGISRACTHQLVRTRIGAGFVGMTSRGEWCIPPIPAEDIHNDRLNSTYVIPPTIDRDKNPEAYMMYVTSMDQQLETYARLIEAGVPSEDARFVLGQGFHTMYSFYINHRALMGFCGVRMCQKAQWEIRLLANAMAYVIRKNGYPEFASTLTPACYRMGRCPYEHVEDNKPDFCQIFAEKDWRGEYILEDHLDPEPKLPDGDGVRERAHDYLHVVDEDDERAYQLGEEQEGRRPSEIMNREIE